MQERLKKLRKELKLSQSAFAEKIFLSHNAINRYEVKGEKPTEQTIYVICERFHVREEWLRHGDGEMFDKKKKEEADLKELIEELIVEYGRDERFKFQLRQIIKVFLELDDANRQKILSFMRFLANGEIPESAKHPMSAPETPKPRQGFPKTA